MSRGLAFFSDPTLLLPDCMVADNGLCPFDGLNNKQNDVNPALQKQDVTMRWITFSWI
jgi:hypothetical protein